MCESCARRVNSACSLRGAAEVGVRGLCTPAPSPAPRPPHAPPRPALHSCPAVKCLWIQLQLEPGLSGQPQWAGIKRVITTLVRTARVDGQRWAALGSSGQLRTAAGHWTRASRCSSQRVEGEGRGAHGSHMSQVHVEERCVDVKGQRRDKHCDVVPLVSWVCKLVVVRPR